MELVLEQLAELQALWMITPMWVALAVIASVVLNGVLFSLWCRATRRAKTVANTSQALSQGFQQSLGTLERITNTMVSSLRASQAEAFNAVKHVVETMQGEE